MKGEWKAATLALGGGAVLSHRSAAELWGLLEPRRGPIDVTVPRRTGHAKRNGIRLHRSTALNDSVATLRDGIPVTKPRRTLADLKRVLKPAGLREVIRAAETSDLPIGDYSRLTERTKSELELMFVELIRRHRLPDPEVNVRIGRFLVDFLWRARRVIVEVDGRRFHRGALATSDDLLRDQRLRELGYVVLRFSYWQVVNEPGEVVAIVRTRL